MHGQKAFVVAAKTMQSGLAPDCGQGSCVVYGYLPGSREGSFTECPLALSNVVLFLGRLHAGEKVASSSGKETLTFESNKNAHYNLYLL